MFKNIYTDNLNMAVFDIESTGLSPDRDIVISASFLDDDGSGLRQYFTGDPKTEFLIIKKIAEEFKQLDAIITYNGKRFDIPFVQTRAKKYGIEIPEILNIDVYLLLKSYWPVKKNMNSLSQKSVEYAMGLCDERVDEISGEQCISLYNDYIATGNTESIDKILLHNADDVKQLHRISEQMSFVPFHKMAFENGFAIKARRYASISEDLLINVSSTKLENNIFTVLANTKTNLPSIDIFEQYYHLDYDSYTGLIRLEIICDEADSYKFVDLKALPVRIDEYTNLEGYNNGFLILVEDNNIKYKEVNQLVGDILRIINEY